MSCNEREKEVKEKDKVQVKEKVYTFLYSSRQLRVEMANVKLKGNSLRKQLLEETYTGD